MIFDTTTLTITRLSGRILSAPEVKASTTTSLAGANNDLTFTAKPVGIIGNTVSVRYVDPLGIDKTLSVTVSVNAITVNLATDGLGAITSTAALIKAAIEASSAANALVEITYPTGNDGSGIVTAMSAVTLSGGIDAMPKGYYSGGSTATFTATGNLQPAGKADLDKLPEGYRITDLRLFLTDTQINMNDKTSIDGITFTAMVIEDFSGQLDIGKYEIIFVKDRGQ
jgi:hypothetical protein